MKFDKEYNCMWTVEQMYLQDCGIRYEFVKKDKNGITVFKYKKTKKLFDALSHFYEELGCIE